MKKSTNKTVRTDSPRSSRQRLADPLLGLPHSKRLVAAGAVDLRNNHRVADLGNGYVQIMPLDPLKRFGKPRKGSTPQ